MSLSVKGTINDLGFEHEPAPYPEKFPSYIAQLQRYYKVLKLEPIIKIKLGLLHTRILTKDQAT